MKREAREVVMVLLTLAASFLSLKLVLALAARAGFSAVDFKDPSAVFKPATIVVVLLVLLAPIALVLAAQRFVHRRKLRELGLRGPWLKPFGWGALAGVIVKLAALSAAVAVSRQARIMPVAAPAGISLWLPYYAWYLFTLLLNSIDEELVYRAYPIAALKGEPRLPVGAVIVAAAAIFSAMHFLIEPPDAMRFLYRFAFGIATGLLFARERTLSAIVGLHTGWNFVALSFSGIDWRLGNLFAISGLDPRVEAAANIAALAALSAAIRALPNKPAR